MTKTKVHIGVASFLSQILLMFVFTNSFGQDLCNQPAGTVKGDFELEEFTFCTPKVVLVRDKSGGQNIRYNFVYQNQGAAELNPNVPFQERYLYTGFTNPTVFTIIQYGTKDGKPMYACKNHVVRQSNKAHYSFTPCNRGSFSLSIPDDSLLNNFDYYEISFDRFNTIYERLEARDLPYDKVINVPLPQRIYVRGVYIDPSRNCGGTIGSDFIPNPESRPSSGLSLPFHANIDALILRDDGMEFDLKGGLGSTYALYKRDLDGTYPTQPLEKGLKVGRRVVKFNNVENQSCFILKKEQAGCIVEESAEICSTPITEIKQLFGKQRVFFDQYPLPYKGVTENSGNNIRVTEQKLEIIENGRLVPRGRPILPQLDSIDYEISNCRQEVCYYTSTFVQGVNNGISFRSEVRSNLKCYDPSKQVIEQSFSLIANVSPENKAEVKIEEVNPNAYPNLEYLIFQKKTNTFEIVDSVTAPTILYESNIDASEKSICFKVQSIDECGSKSELSDPVCTLFLSFDNNENLVWSQDSPFSSPIENFEIITGSVAGLVNASTDQLSASEFQFQPNLNQYRDQVSFRLKANSSVGESYSNSIDKLLDPLIFLPTSFTPNSDDQNDVLFLFGNTQRVKSINFKVLNRRGQTVFYSSDPNFRWQPKDSEAPVGNYYYDLLITLDNDAVLKKNGSIWILK